MKNVLCRTADLTESRLVFGLFIGATCFMGFGILLKTVVFIFNF